jgi:hypothetical protein
LVRLVVQAAIIGGYPGKNENERRDHGIKSAGTTPGT